MRQGETLARIGKMAELFDDHSPLQLQASGVWNKLAFTLVGRLQYKYGEGTWTEWHAVLGDGSSAFLSEDNGAYVFATALETQRELPEADFFRVGRSTAINGKTYTITANNQVALMAAQGELPRLPVPGTFFAMVELRGQGEADLGLGDGASIIGRDIAPPAARRLGGEVISIDYSIRPPHVCIGQAVLLDELKLTGLREDATKEEKGRAFSCPNCGAQLTVTLAASKSMTCGSCNSIIDLSQGVGSELKHALQDEPVTPLIPLGTMGKLQGVDWQVVGFQHRMGVDPNDSDEQFGWDEYLLYNLKRGFIFLVDSTEGWSVVQPTTGAPVMNADGASASYLGTRYALKESYNAETSYVAGEFYWQVTRGQKTSNRDFVSGNSVLSLEQSPNELTWSLGSKVNSDTIAKAFALEDKKDLLKRSDATPVSATRGVGCVTVVALIFILLVVLAVLSQCSSCDPSIQNCSSGGSARSSGGSFGGFSGGGGHK